MLFVLVAAVTIGSPIVHVNCVFPFVAILPALPITCKVFVCAIAKVVKMVSTDV
jgi:hypothetical protein